MDMQSNNNTMNTHQEHLHHSAHDQSERDLSGRDMTKSNGLAPLSQGLYDSRNEKDSCGVGFVAHIKGQKSHDIVAKGLELLKNLTHRGATGYDPKLGDGAGLLMQMPDTFMREEAAKLGITLPEAGLYAVGQTFLPQDANNRAKVEAVFTKIIAEEKQTLLIKK